MASGAQLTEKQINRRVAAVKTADAINAIEGTPVSDYARDLSHAWARGELTGEQMKEALLASHRKLSERLTEFYGEPIEQIDRIQSDGEIDWGEASGHEVW